MAFPTSVAKRVWLRQATFRTRGEMFSQAPEAAEFSEAWIESDERGRWRSAPGHGPSTGSEGSGSSTLEVEPGCILPRHIDSADELIVIVSGAATVIAGQETSSASAGAIALVPAGLPHEVHNAGKDLLRFWAVYAAPDVTTTYDEPVQPDGERERSPLG